jgi:hypothetical protein
MPRISESASAATRDKAIRLAEQKLAKKMCNPSIKVIGTPKTKTWAEGVFGYGAKVTVEIAPMPGRRRWPFGKK